jgi:hypothetical protein
VAKAEEKYCKNMALDDKQSRSLAHAMPALAAKIAKQCYTFEEDLLDINDDSGAEGAASLGKRQQRQPQKFKGYIDETYQATAGRAGEPSTANYAIMIYDSKKNEFRIVPIEKHFMFEKGKLLVEGEESYIFLT